jgi:murein DD-endopeptidase MepM/ murein hydrolase activator NlpD
MNIIIKKPFFSIFLSVIFVSLLIPTTVAYSAGAGWSEVISQHITSRQPTQLASLNRGILPSSQSLFKRPSSSYYIKHSIKTVSLRILKKYRRTKKSLPSGWPVRYGRVSSPFGRRWGRMHKGIDLASPTGTPVHAVEGGVVSRSKYMRGYGNLVEIRHSDMYITRYGHNSKRLVKAGQKVRKGQVIALVGSTGRSTGPHVHFEVRQNGTAINPVRFLGAMRSFSLKDNLELTKYVRLTKR